MKSTGHRFSIMMLNPAGHGAALATVLMVLMVLTAILLLLTSSAEAAKDGMPKTLDDAVDQEPKALDLKDLRRFVDETNRELQGYAPQLSLEGLLQGLKEQGIGYDFRELLTGLVRYLWHDVLVNSGFLGKIIVLAVICSLLQSLQSGFASEDVGRLAYFVCYLALAYLALQGFATAFSGARLIVSRLTSFMLAMVPILAVLLATVGAVTTAGLFHPLMIASINLVTVVINYGVVPAVFFAGILDVVSSFSDTVKVGSFVSLVRQASVFILGFFFTVFLGVMSLQGAAGTVADGVALRTAKYMVNMIPVVGKMFSDAAELMFTGTLLLKNTLGILGALIVLLITLFPLIKILSVVLVYRLAAALIQPIGGGKIVACLHSLANSLMLMFVATATVGLMFFISIAIVVTLGNASVMMR